MIPRTSTTNPTNMLTDDFYNEAVFVGKGGYYKGNTNYQCVNFAVAETCRLANRAVCYYNGVSKKEDIEKPMFNRNGYGNAISWWSETLWEKGSEPRLGSVMVYGSAYGNGNGHVRVVEKIDGNKLFISGGNESGKMAFKWIDIPQITATGFLGYIYNPYVSKENGLIVFDLDKEHYEYKWSVDGNKYGEPYDSTNENGFADTELEKQGYEMCLKVNGSLFYYYNDGNRNNCYACGLEKAFGENHQDASMSAVSDYNECMAIAGIDDELYFGKQGWIISNILKKSYCAITGMGLLLSGSKRDDLHKGFESQWNQKSGRTVIGEDSQGNFMSYSFAGETGKSGMTCKELQDKCLELGFCNAICLDGGGSVFRWANGAYDISSSRKVKNALMLYRKKKEVAPQPTLEERYNELEKNYKVIKQAYDTLLDTNQELKNEIEIALDKQVELANQLTEVQNTNNELTGKIDKIKELLL